MDSRACVRFSLFALGAGEKMATKGPVTEWTVREQLILASAVQRSGDQNWVSVSRAVKPLVEDARPPDYFSQKNCALQYSAMLDKAKHPKRKRSNDGTPESAVTVEEHIVRQLTERRIKELDSSISDTRIEYYALKKEIEQIESGELEGELPALWEKLQAELVAKESSDSKGSRARKSSTTTPTAEGDHPKRQKMGGAASGPADKPREKSSHKSPDKRSSQAAPPEAPSTPLLPSVKEESPMVVPETTSIPAPSPSPNPLAGGSAQRGSSKRRNLESLPLGPAAVAGGGDLATHDESPLPYPMTVPKEEQLRETLASSGGQLSRSLVLPLSPDMHVIVQQPNVAALSAGSLPTPSPTPDGDAHLKTLDSSQNVPPPAPSAPSVAPASGAECVPQPPGADGAQAVVKQEVATDLPLPSPARPRTVAEALRSAAAVAVPQPVSIAAQQPLIPLGPSLLPPSSAPPLGLSLQRAPLSQVGLRPPLPHTLSSSSEVIPPPPSSTSPRLSPSKQAHPQLGLTPPVAQPPLSAPMTVVSSVLSDPRLTSRPGTTRTAPVQSTLQQVLDKSKPQSTNQTTVDKAKIKTPITSGLGAGDKGKSNPQMTSQTTGDKEKSKTKPMTINQTTADKGKETSPATNQTAAEKSKANSQTTTPQITTPPDKAQPLLKTTDKGKPLPSATTDDNSKPPTVPTTGDKTKSKPPVATTVKSRPPAEAERKNSSGESTSQAATQQAAARALQESLPQPTVDIVREPRKTAEGGGDQAKCGLVPAAETGERGPSLAQPVSEGGTDGSKKEPSAARRVSVGEEEKAVKEELVDVVTPEEKWAERGAAVEVVADPPSSRGVPSSGGVDQIDAAEVHEEGRQGGNASDGGGGGAPLDESMQVEAGSSRRSSVSELPSSPLATIAAAGAKEEPPEPEENPPRRKQTRTSKKLWPTRSRKRKLDADEGMSTDLESEEELSSLVTSAEPSPAPSQGDGDPDSGMSKKQWKKAIMLVWRHAAQHKYANLFLHPVRDDDAPGYREVIHRPMDLSSVKRNIENGVTTTDIEFQRDMLLMFQNAFMYNSSDHDVYEMAEKMRADVMQSIQDYLSTQLQLIVESSTPKVLRSRDKEGRRGDAHDEALLTPVKKRRTRADD